MFTQKGKWLGVFALLAVSITTGLSAWCSEPVDIKVAKEGFAGVFYEATDNTIPVGIVVLGGSEGGIPKGQGATYAREGFSTLALGYFKVAGTPDNLDEIPLEYFDKPLEWFAKQPAMQGKKIVLRGGSKGAELALLLASRKAEIAGVIASAPSSVVFQGIPKIFWPPRSSWKYEDKSLTFVPYDVSQGVDVKNLRPLYELSLSHQEIVDKASIPVEKINGPILLLSGEDDSMWPASEMAEAMVSRLKSHEFAHPYKHVKCKDAGHTLNEFHMLGGTTEGNKKARHDSRKEILGFLSDNF